MSPRPYRTPEARRHAAELTRDRILAATRDLLATPTGVRDFSLQAVGDTAGVARMTVYYQFKSKGGLLEALFDWLAAAGGLGDLPRAFQTADARAALARFVATFVRFWASDRLVLRRLRALAATDPELEPVFRARDERRREGLRVLVGRLAPTGDPVELVDVLHALTSFEMFDDLSHGGRSPDEVTRLIQRLVDASLS
jgi:AcrR family transcriptional regulator